MIADRFIPENKRIKQYWISTVVLCMTHTSKINTLRESGLDLWTLSVHTFELIVQWYVSMVLTKVFSVFPLVDGGCVLSKTRRLLNRSAHHSSIVSRGFCLEVVFSRILQSLSEWIAVFLVSNWECNLLIENITVQYLIFKFMNTVPNIEYSTVNTKWWIDNT